MGGGKHAPGEDGSASSNVSAAAKRLRLLIQSPATSGGQSAILSCFSPRLRNRYRAYSRALVKRGLLPTSYLEPIPEDGVVLYNRQESLIQQPQLERIAKNERDNTSSIHKPATILPQREEFRRGVREEVVAVENEEEEEEEEDVDEHFGFIASLSGEKWTHHRKDWILLLVSVIVALVSAARFLLL